VQLFVLGARFDFQPQTARVRTDSQETRIEGERCAGLLGFAGQCGNQARALNDEVRLGQGDLRRAAVGEKLEAANFVDDALARGCAHDGGSDP